MNEYDKFVATHKYHLSSPVISKLIADIPDGALLLSLEASYTKAISTDQARKLGKEPRKAEAEPSAILSKRVIFPYTAPEKTSNPQDALAITLSEQGKVDMDKRVNLGIADGDELTVGDTPAVLVALGAKQLKLKVSGKVLIRSRKENTKGS